MGISLKKMHRWQAHTEKMLSAVVMGGRNQNMTEYLSPMVMAVSGRWTRSTVVRDLEMWLGD